MRTPYIYLCLIILLILIWICIFSVSTESQLAKIVKSKVSVVVGISKTNSTTLLPPSSSASASFRFPDVMYGHVHMAKTGGTYLNGFLANKFEKVCGHKGYSYDAYQANERFKKKTSINNNITNLEYGRDRVQFSTMKQIGFEECDFISTEQTWKFWLQFNDFHDTPMELHLPCRDPIDHLMSQCNHRNKSFSCQNITDDDDEEMIKRIKPCLIFVSRRFNNTLNALENIHLKCYDFRYQFTHYIDYISANLRPRRFVSEYKKRETNRKRVKENECIWNDEILMQRVKSYLVTNVSYYKFCGECLKGENDLTRDVI